MKIQTKEEQKTLLLKLSGEALAGKDEKFSEAVLDHVVEQIIELLKQDIHIALVVGGGNLFRGKDLIGKLEIEHSTADYIGMLATVQNALVLRDYFESRGVSTRVLSAISMSQICEPYIPKRARRHLKKGRVVIFAAGTGMPFFTTDTTAVQRALEIGASPLVMVKNNVDGLYSADPKDDPTAKKIDRTTASEVLAQNLKAADGAAIALAKEHGLSIKIISLDDISTVLDSSKGSVVEPR